MDTTSGQTNTASAEKLVQELNDLLASLSLPITLATPYDLTPSLLLAILESILRERLPISAETRKSHTPAAKVEAMKVFLGVLEDDVLRTDIGLSEIDPRRLAAGEWDEIVFVGETLCWLGRHQKVHQSTSNVPAVSSSGDSRTNTSADTGYFRYEGSETNATTLPSFDSGSVTPIADPPSPRRRPRCIHEFDVSSFSFDLQSIDKDDVEEDALCDCSVDPPQNASYGCLPLTSPRPPVRYQGLIRPAEHEMQEIEKFEAWQKSMRSRTLADTFKSATPRRSNTTLRNPTRHTSPSQYTLQLLNERARLLEELARLKISRPRGP